MSQLSFVAVEEKAYVSDDVDHAVPKPSVTVTLVEMTA